MRGKKHAISCQVGRERLYRITAIIPLSSPHHSLILPSSFPYPYPPYCHYCVSASNCLSICLPTYYSLYFIPFISPYILQSLTPFIPSPLYLNFAMPTLSPSPPPSLSLSLLHRLCHSYVLLLPYYYLSSSFNNSLFNQLNPQTSLYLSSFPYSSFLTLSIFYLLSPSPVPFISLSLPLSLCPLLHFTLLH